MFAILPIDVRLFMCVKLESEVSTLKTKEEYYDAETI